MSPSSIQAHSPTEYLCPTCSIPTIPPFEDPSSSMTLSLLRSSYCPSDSESNDLMASIESFSSQIAAYKAHISSLLQALQFLRGEKSKADMERKKKRSLLSPIRRLPPEILGEIFRFYCSDEVERSRNSRWSKSKRLRSQHRFPTPALTLTRVCKHWSEIVRTNPLVWPVINVRLDDISKRELGLLYMSLRSTKETALVVDATMRESFDPDDEVDGVDERRVNATKGFGLLLGYSKRWKEAKLSLTWEVFEMLGRGWKRTNEVEDVQEQESEPGSQLEFSQLEVLDLNIDFFIEPHLAQLRGNIGSNAFSSASNLRRLTMSENPGYFPNLPFSGLTSLTLKSFAHHYIRVIDETNCPNLKTFDIKWGFEMEDSISYDVSSVTSTSLTRLRIDNVFENHHMQLFKNLNLPSLGELEVHSPPLLPCLLPETSDTDALIGMLKRSKPPLKRLVLENMYFRLEDWIGRGGILSRLSNLTHLQMPMQAHEPSSFCGESFVKALGLDASGDTTDNQENFLPVFLPNVRTLSLSVQKMMDTPLLEAICDMLQSRLSSLTSFSVCMDRGWHDEAAPQVRRFKVLAREAKEKVLSAGELRTKHHQSLDLEPGFHFEWFDWESGGRTNERHRLGVFDNDDLDGQEEIAGLDGLFT